jgi:hypothetical protein
MRSFMHSHQGAEFALPTSERVEIEAAIKACELPIQRRAGPAIRTLILEALDRTGWSGEFSVEPPSRITITSVKNGVGLCIQTGGNMSRMYADLLKLQKLYTENRITVGAFILPTSDAARLLGDNVANADLLQSELSIFRKVIHMPIAVFAFE